MQEIKEKKNHGRKIAAGAFGVLGIMGLGLAAATQLDIGWEGNFQAGAVAVEADCQTSPITTKFASPEFDSSGDIPWDVDGVQFSDIDAACAGLNYQVTYRTGDTWSAPTSGTVAGTTIDFAMRGVDVQDVQDFALTIYGG